MSQQHYIEPLENRTLLSAFSAHVNFQPLNAPVPAGYLVDAGLLYRQRGAYSYGWQSANRNAVDRNSRLSPDQRYDTFNTLDFGKLRNWEIAVPNGAYQVHLVAGDPLDQGAYYRIRAETTTVIDAKNNKKKHWKEGIAIVKVTDGKLTLSAIKGAIRNKICFIDIIGLTDPTKTLEAELADASSGTTINGASVASLDSGDYLQFRNVLFNSHIESIYASLSVSPENAGGFFEFHIDSPTGPLLGALKTQPTGRNGEFVTQHADIDGVPDGIHDLFVVYKGSKPCAAIDWLRFDNRPLTWIMPVGDSITEGLGGHSSYRRDLYRSLEDTGYAIDFVGTRNGVRPGTGDPAQWDFDMDHQGVFGQRADQLLSGLDAPLNSEMPDIVLLDIGINDISMGQSTDSTAAEIGQIIDKMRAHNPGMIILLALLSPSSKVADSLIVEMNDKITALAAAKNTTFSPIVLVDLHTGFDPAVDTYDGIHPTPDAEARQAQLWFEALQTVLPPPVPPAV
ncbi:MAG TPA: GDSL-type esterase/lipase family protein [Tepidisphaeraceae bacterium]|jgi:lysophospholipase L1-like esterase|nr:GDSL-type esterase/lipase family protein [Tepidisphaeraceae bacterium]